MRGNGYGSSRSQRHLSWARSLVLGLILSICLAWVSASPAWSETLNLSEADLQALWKYWEEIRLGLNMTDASLSEIGSYFESESERLRQEKLDLQSESERLQQEKSSLDRREQALTEREQRISQREKYYRNIELDLRAAAKSLRWSKIIGTIVAITAAVGGFFLGNM